LTVSDVIGQTFPFWWCWDHSKVKRVERCILHLLWATSWEPSSELHLPYVIMQCSLPPNAQHASTSDS